jgi:hypothetical protein
MHSMKVISCSFHIPKKMWITVIGILGSFEQNKLFLAWLSDET